jgi:hypothetical protein
VNETKFLANDTRGRVGWCMWTKKLLFGSEFFKKIEAILKYVPIKL